MLMAMALTSGTEAERTPWVQTTRRRRSPRNTAVLVNGAAKQNNKMSAYILGVVNSAAFRMSGPETPGAKTAKAAESQ